MWTVVGVVGRLGDSYVQAAAGSYVCGGDEDLGEEDAGQAVSAEVQRGHSELHHMLLVPLHAQVQQTAGETCR